MAIKIKQGMSPQAGRITMPKGTFLSNPSTAADGQLGAGGGTLPGVPQIPLGGSMWNGVTPGYNAQLTPNTLQTNTQSNVAGYNPFSQYAYQPPPGVPRQYQKYVDAIQRSQNPVKPVTTTAFAPNSSTSPGNSLVGSDVSAMPNTMNLTNLRSIVGNLPFEQMQEIMRMKGYEWVAQPGGGFFMKGAESADANTLSKSQSALLNSPLDERGRPIVSPFALGAVLERGERAVVSGGYGVTGGAEFTDAAGKTVAQYAVTMPGQGDRWKYKIQKDNDGNWVRIYYKTFSKAKSRRGQRLRAQRRERKFAEEQAKGTQDYPQSGQDFEQLVNLRADYG